MKQAFRVSFVVFVAGFFSAIPLARAGVLGTIADMVPPAEQAPCDKECLKQLDGTLNDPEFHRPAEIGNKEQNRRAYDIKANNASSDSGSSSVQCQNEMRAFQKSTREIQAATNPCDVATRTVQASRQGLSWAQHCVPNQVEGHKQSLEWGLARKRELCK